LEEIESLPKLICGHNFSDDIEIDKILNHLSIVFQIINFKRATTRLAPTSRVRRGNPCGCPHAYELIFMNIYISIKKVITEITE
jgi:hypothetical protein